jgi:poly-gamma-glutamate synthesis protein (capsule biosynthesis protein)
MVLREFAWLFFLCLLGVLAGCDSESASRTEAVVVERDVTQPVESPDLFVEPVSTEIRSFSAESTPTPTPTPTLAPSPTPTQPPTATPPVLTKNREAILANSLRATQLWRTDTAEMVAYRDLNEGEELGVHIAAVGDIMLARYLGDQIWRGYIDYPFAAVRESLFSADFTVGNLECALGDSGEPQPKSYTFQAPTEAAETLARAGFDLVSLANNHALDYGETSLLEGIDLLSAQSIGTIGAGINADAARKPVITTIDGIKVAFLGYVNVPNEYRGYQMVKWEAGPEKIGVAWGHPELIAADVTAVAPDVDHVIVMLHSGFEYQIAPSAPQVAASQAAIDAGATLVIGHHAHILQGVEFYGDGIIVYGLGNFAFEIDGDPSTTILNVWLDQDGVQLVTFEPAVIQVGGQPRLATEAEAPAILEQIAARSRQLNSADTK